MHDESYTPKKLIIKAETISGDILNVCFVDIDIEPTTLHGWIKISFKDIKLFDGIE